MIPTSDRQSARVPKTSKTVGQRLLSSYTALASRGEHLLQTLLGGQAPRQWHHYPEDDAIDAGSAYQWFYHSHSPEDRPGTSEHGHFHLFARRPLWSHRMQSNNEKDFASLTHQPRKQVNTRHLLCISLNAQGLPISLFTVNSWVTGDLMLSAALTERLLAQMRLNTGHTEIDTVLECVITLCHEEIHQLLIARDITLSNAAAPNVLENHNLELLSEWSIDLDRNLG